MRQATANTALFLYRCSVTPNHWGEPWSAWAWQDSSRDKWGYMGLIGLIGDVLYMQERLPLPILISSFHLSTP